MPRPTDWESRIGRRVTLRDLHILAAVVRWGSMAKAASHLAMSQSAVSEAVAQLESAVRVRLLDRTARGIAPTIYAETLLKRSNTVFDELRQAVKDIEFLTNPTAGELRVAAPEFLSAWLMPSAIDRLSRRHPHIGVRVVQPNTTTFEFQELRDRTVDLTLARVPKGFASDEMDIEVLFDDPHFVVAATDSSWARRRKISLAEIGAVPWIVPPSPIVDAVLADMFAAEGLAPPATRITANSVALRMLLLSTGRFLAVFPQSVLRTVARQWSIKVLSIDLHAESQPIAIVTLKNRTVSPIARLFIEELRTVAGGAAPDKPRS